jgi:large subunit ribosomal protein L23
MDYSQIVIRPLVSEKSTKLQTTRNTYTFRVAPDANKGSIKTAVEALYNVKVADVRTLNRKGKPRRSKFRMTQTPDYKRAIVTLAGDSKIEIL